MVSERVVFANIDIGCHKIRLYHHPWFLSLYYIFLVPSSNKLFDLNFDFVNSIQIRYWNQPVLSNECNVSCLKKQWGSNSHLTDYESNELPTASRQHSPCGFLLTVYKDCMSITHFEPVTQLLSNFTRIVTVSK